MYTVPKSYSVAVVINATDPDCSCLTAGYLINSCRYFIMKQQIRKMFLASETQTDNRDSHSGFNIGDKRKNISKVIRVVIVLGEIQHILISISD